MRKLSSKGKDGELKRTELRCDKGRNSLEFVEPAELEGRKRKRVTSRMTGCPFHVVITRQKSLGDQWLLRVICANHNHKGSPPITHPGIRYRERGAYSDAVQTETALGNPPSVVQDRLRHESDRQALITKKDISNMQQRFRTESLGGLTPTQALLQQLQSSGKWIVDYEVDNLSQERNLTALFFATTKSRELLRRYPYVLIMDCTYKTNVFNMPLMDIIGVSPLNRLYFVGMCFIRSETTTSFLFPLRQIRTLYDRFRLPYPGAIFTDKDDGLRRALLLTFPDSRRLLCLWHINNHIKGGFSSAFKVEIAAELEEREQHQQHSQADAARRRREREDFQAKRHKEKKDALMGHWMRVVNSWDEEGYRRAWEDFRAEYAPEVYSDLIDYVEEEWLSVRSSFVKAFTKHIRHFEQNTTSKAEAAHSAIKRSLTHSQGNMFETVREIERTVFRMLDEHISG